jgi:hypothetical protein
MICRGYDSLYNLCCAVQITPAAVCQNAIVDGALHPVEPFAVRVTLAGEF